MTKRLLIVAFTGFGGKLAGQTELDLRQTFETAEVGVAVLQDQRRTFFLKGSNRHLDVDSLRSDLRMQMRAADRTVFLGSSGGAFGALKHGLELGADAVVCFSGFTRFDTAAKQHDPRGERALARLWDAEPDDARRNAANLWAAAARTPRAMLHFSRLHGPDRFQSMSMAHLPGVELRVLPGDRHGLPPDMAPAAHRRLFHQALEALEIGAPALDVAAAGD